MPDRNVLRLVRNDQPFRKRAQLLSLIDELETQLKTVDRQRFGMLVDTRLAPMRREPGFEAAFKHFRERVVKGFARVAVLVATEEGREQAAEYSEHDGEHVRVFTSEGDALTWLDAAEGGGS